MALLIGMFCVFSPSLLNVKLPGQNDVTNTEVTEQIQTSNE
jgi:hypothetical protein